MKGRFLISIFFSFILAYAGGQTLTDTIQIKEVKVFAKRKPEEAGLKITRPDSLSLASTLTTSLSELISDYSPVFIKSYGRGSVATASFRGTSASHTQILWNGMNLNSPMRGMADLSLLPVFFADKVWLLHGGSSTIKGSGALGGSINLDNKPDWSSKLNVKAVIEEGSFHTHKFFLKFNKGSDRLSVNTRLFYETSQNDFKFYNSGIIPHREDTLENAQYWKTGILQELYFRRTREEILTLRFWYQQSRRDLPQLMSYEGSDREEYQNDRQLRAQFDWKKYSDRFNYNFFSGINSGRLKYYRSTPEFDFVNEDSESLETGFLNHLKISGKIDEDNYGEVSLDANYYQVKATDIVKQTGYREDRFETSLMVNMHLRLSERLNAFGLLRSEYYDERFVPFIPAAGLEWQLYSKLPLVLSLNAARNYHKPALNDLYWLPGGNPGLLPEDGFSGDISLEGNIETGRGRIDNEFTWFYSVINNWIMWQPAASGAYYWEADNVKDVVSGGLEYRLSAEYNLNELRFRSGGNYSYTKTSNVNAVSSADRSRGKQLIYIPKHKGNLYLSCTWRKYTLKYDLNYTGKRYTKSSNIESYFEQVLNPYWLSKVVIDKQVEWNNYTLNLKFTVENIFDNNYQSILWRPMPGRFYSFSLGFSGVK